MSKLFHGRVVVVWVALLLGLALSAPPCLAQGVEVAHRPVAEIRVQGLHDVPEKLVRNQIRQVVGEPYDPEAVRQDIVRITHLGRFGTVEANVQPKGDGTVILTYIVSELPLLSDVQVVGNKAISDQELLGLAGLKAGDPKDQFLIDRGIREIKRAYEKKGYFVTEVTVDTDVLNESGVLLYHVREGPRPRIHAIGFRGNVAFSDSQLASKIKSKTSLWFLRKGEVNTDQLEDDAATVRKFYADRGYLDAQVGRVIDLSPDQRGAVVTFVIQEGKRYTVARVVPEGNVVFTREELLEAMALKAGDVYSADRIKKSQTLLLDIYGRMGFLDTRVDIQPIYDPSQPLVDVKVIIVEGNAYTAGKVWVKGNETTKEKVVTREQRGMNPGERFDRTQFEQTKTRLKELPEFSEANITLQGDPKDTTRDALVEVKEKNTGSLGFSAGVTSDAGVIGAITLTQRNFDIGSPPESFGELFTGRAFHGAGQYFSVALEPGNELSRYSLTFREPYLFDTNIFLDSSVYYYQRLYDDYDDQRIGAQVSLGQRFGDVWSGAVRFRGEAVRISAVQSGAPIDVWQVQGDSTITSAGFYLIRNSTDSRLFPTTGTRFEVGFSHAGAMGGDYTFDEISTDFRAYWTLDEDFYGRKTVLSFHNNTSQIVDGDAPIFERLFAGGERTLRGFAFRGVSPRGRQAYTNQPANGGPLPSEITPNGQVVFLGNLGDEPAGGNFMFLNSVEYNFPVYKEIVRVVVFSDSGTVQDGVGIDQYRVSIGTGLRIQIPFLGPQPFALDFAIPVIKQRGDQTQFFSFDLAVPF